MALRPPALDTADTADAPAVSVAVTVPACRPGGPGLCHQVMHRLMMRSSDLPELPELPLGVCAARQRLTSVEILADISRY
jgi:hypothetical protein